MKNIILALALIVVSFIAISAIQPSNDNALRGHAGTCVMQADGSGPYKSSHYSCVAYNPHMCLLPSVEESYQELPITRCVNTGKVATQADKSALIFADACQPHGYVPCVPTCTLRSIPVPCTLKHDEVQG